MAKSIYLGVAGTAHKVKKMYTSIDGKARKVKKGYIGVNGVARQFYSAGYGDAPEGTYALNADADAMIYSIDPNTMINLGTVGLWAGTNRWQRNAGTNGHDGRWRLCRGICSQCLGNR